MYAIQSAAVLTSTGLSAETVTERDEFEWQVLVGNDLIEVHARERNLRGTNQTLIVIGQEVGLVTSVVSLIRATLMHSYVLYT